MNYHFDTLCAPSRTRSGATVYHNISSITVLFYQSSYLPFFSHSYGLRSRDRNSVRQGISLVLRKIGVIPVVISIPLPRLKIDEIFTKRLRRTIRQFATKVEVQRSDEGKKRFYRSNRCVCLTCRTYFQYNVNCNYDESCYLRLSCCRCRRLCASRTEVHLNCLKHGI